MRSIPLGALAATCNESKREITILVARYILVNLLPCVRVTDLGSFRILPIPEQGIEFTNEQLIGRAKIVPDGEAQRHVWILEVAVDDDETHAQHLHLALAIDAANTVAWFVGAVMKIVSALIQFM